MMNTNRLDNVADRQRANHIRDLLFVLAVAVILIVQIASLSQARAFSHNFWLGADQVQEVRVTQPVDCTDKATEKLAALPDSAPHC